MSQEAEIRKRRVRARLVGIAVAALLIAGGAVLFATRVNQRGMDAVGGLSRTSTPDAQAPRDSDTSGYQTYSNPEPRFSFRYPSGFTVSPIEDESGGTLLVRNPNEQKREFQIRISEFDEPGPITKERIRKDIPDMVIENPQYVILSAPSSVIPSASEESRDSSASPQNDGMASSQNDVHEGVRALAFLSRDESLGATREVWFVSDGFLYQITAYAEMDNVLGEILETWEFQ